MKQHQKAQQAHLWGEHEPGQQYFAADEEKDYEACGILHQNEIAYSTVADQGLKLKVATASAVRSRVICT